MIEAHARQRLAQSRYVIACKSEWRAVEPEMAGVQRSISSNHYTITTDGPPELGLVIGSLHFRVKDSF